jgi:hypothetical protein
MLIRSLLDSPLLVGDLPMAAQFDRRGLSASTDIIELNFDQKLGHIYEDALASLLTSSSDIELVERNLQIRTDIHTTVGELDFLIRRSGGTLTHVELATKFYLAIETEDGFAYPGPDARDNYQNKIERLLSHQLTLIERYKSDLPAAYRDETIDVKQLIYGCLFDHIGQTKRGSPPFCSPTCRRGKWLRHGEVPDHFPANSQFNLIPKYFWPVPTERLTNIKLERWYSSEPFERCVMICVEGDSLPYFVTPNEYPNQSIG